MRIDALSALLRKTFLFFLSQPRRSSLRWKHARSLPGYLRRVWWWLWGRGTNCSYWEMHSHVQLPWYVTGCFSWLHYSTFLKSTVCIMRRVASQSAGLDVWGIVLDRMSWWKEISFLSASAIPPGNQWPSYNMTFEVSLVLLVYWWCYPGQESLGTYSWRSVFFNIIFYFCEYF